ncbi:MAG: 1-acyl-sn-glycerol-3-phosphate acyltransferase, partial [Terriglobus roseus]|nr:1-acyl-sn-glycerol-3-phosphate acyltransferase [Terriglobus roseus]
QSIIFLPCHRSHVDYVSLQIICYRLGLALPTVVAGDNLNFPLVGPFLQHAGAMYIRRSFGNDRLYSTVVQSYIDTLLQNGFNFECFVEGGRSRTGKLLPPKFGILGFLLDSVLSGRVEDAIVCPVSTQYDKVLEVDSYISELLGQPKKKENLSDFAGSAGSILSLRLGRVDVRFHEPWSLRGFIDDQQARFSRMPQQIDGKPEEPADSRLRILRTLGYRVLKEINDVSVVMPTALIGTILLTLRGRGVGKAELIRRVEWLSDRVRSRGGRVAHFAGVDTAAVVERGLQVLGPNLVGVVFGLAEETYYAVDRFQLSFYRNMTIHLFILEAVTSAALYLKVKQGGSIEDQRMSYVDLRAQVSFLSQLFRGEFIFPTEGLDTNLSRTLQILRDENVLKLTPNETTPENTDFVELSDQERERGRENYDFYCFCIWPFIEAAWLGAVSLMMLTPPLGHTGEVRLELNKAQNQAQLVSLTLHLHFTRITDCHPHSSARRSTTKATSPTSRPSTRRPSKMPTTASRKKVSSSSTSPATRRSPPPSASRPIGLPPATPPPASSSRAASCGTLRTSSARAGVRARTGATAGRCRPVSWGLWTRSARSCIGRRMLRLLRRRRRMRRLLCRRRRRALTRRCQLR